MKISSLCIGHYVINRLPQGTILLTETCDNAWVAGKGINSVEVNTTVPRAVYLSR